MGFLGFLATVACGIVAFSLPAWPLLWLTRRRLAVRVLDARGQPVAGARVRGHATAGGAQWVDGNGAVRGGRSETYARTLGRTDREGRWSGTLFLTNPWALSAVADGHAESELRVLREPGAGGVREVTLQLGPATSSR